MARQSPLRKLQEQAEAEFIHYGHTAHRQSINDSASAELKGPPGPPPHVGLGVDVVATYGEIEAEYAAIRKGAALMECPQRGLVRIIGSERRDFLNRMVTNDIKALTDGASIRAFWLNRKGRIDADLHVTEIADALWLEVDQSVAPHVVNSLSSFVFSEDVAVEDVTDEFHRIALYGPASSPLLSTLITFAGARALTGPEDLHQNRSAHACIGGVTVILQRRDHLHVPGYEILTPVNSAISVHETILEAGLASQCGMRAIGWHAFNIARIESGRPFFLIDFGPDSLPHETGVLREAVSFTKGCYLGQEIVARMEHLGRPTKMLAGLRMTSKTLESSSKMPSGPSIPLQPTPISGAQIFDPSDPLGEVIGVVTSSTLSPMLGHTAIAFAMMKANKTVPGTRLIVNADAGGGVAVRAEAIVAPQLQFWPSAT